MSVATTSPAPASGWYPDPTDREILRWWDGDGWSTHATEIPSLHDLQQAAEAADAAGSRAKRPRRRRLRREAVQVPEQPPVFERVGTTEAFEAAIGAARDPEPDSEPDPEHDIEPQPFFQAKPVVVAPAPAPAVVAEPAPVVVAKPAPAPVVVAEPAPATVETDAAPAKRRRPAVKVAAVLVAAAVGAGGAALAPIGGSNDAPATAAAKGPTLTAAERQCITMWNASEAENAGDLRVTLGQLAGAAARVSRVDPLPGTLMQGNACALAVNDAKSQAQAMFVTGVAGHDGFLDITAYPRAATYGWPATKADGNVSVQPDGTLRAMS